MEAAATRSAIPVSHVLKAGASVSALASTSWRCHRLRYETQYEPPFARAATRALKIRERLGDKGGIDDPFPARPKHMRRKTFERLEDEYYRLNDAWAVGIMGRFRS